MPPPLLLLLPSRISSFQNKSILLTRKSFPCTQKKIARKSEWGDNWVQKTFNKWAEHWNIGIDVVRRMFCYVMYLCAYMRICRISDTVKYRAKLTSIHCKQPSATSKIPNVYAHRIVNARHVFDYLDGGCEGNVEQANDWTRQKGHTKTRKTKEKFQKV